MPSHISLTESIYLITDKKATFPNKHVNVGNNRIKYGLAKRDWARICYTMWELIYGFIHMVAGSYQQAHLSVSQGPLVFLL